MSEEYGKLGDRERWPILWLEDDPAMWLPQFHVHRGKRDLDLAEKYGCQGVLGIHWRNRIMSADAGFQSRASWDRSLEPAKLFEAFAAVQADGPRPNELAGILNSTDRDRLILNSFTGKIADGHHEVRAYAGDYDEGFAFWEGYDPPREVLVSQAKVAHELRELTERASDPAEHERLNYLTTYVEFLVPYSESWILASRIHHILQDSHRLKHDGRASEARQSVLNQAVPLWKELALQVRKALLTYQQTVTERNEQRALASLHNKYERLTLFRLRLSMKEFVGELPAEVDQLFREVRRKDPSARPRVFIPARPSAIETGEKVRISAVAIGGETVPRVILFLRRKSSEEWRSLPMELLGRRTFMMEVEAERTDSPFLEYYVRVEFTGPKGRYWVTAPVDAPRTSYAMTLL